MIPLLLIPQMILSGLLFNFDKLNDHISAKGKVPIIADLMASRWAYEALAVNQFRNNGFQKAYYDLEKIASQADFRSSFLITELDKKRKFIADNLGTDSDSVRQLVQKDIKILHDILEDDYFKKGIEDVLVSEWTIASYTPALNTALEEFFQAYKKFYQNAYNLAISAQEVEIYKNQQTGGYDLNTAKNSYYNESLADLVKNVSVKDRIIEQDGRLFQQINPIFLDPNPANAFDYRTHFFAPQKNLLGAMVSTFWFNALVIWLMTVILYATLYLEALRRLINSFDGLGGKLPIPKVAGPKNK
jgi:hypothetical protein